MFFKIYLIEGHGIPNLFKTDLLILRISWILFILAAIAGCAFINTKALMNYLSYEVTTKISVVSETPLEFPVIKIYYIIFSIYKFKTITMCGGSPFITKNGTDFSLLKINEIHKELENGTMQQKWTFEFIWSILDFTRYLISNLGKDPNLTDEYRKSFGLKLNETIITCIFNIEGCTEDDFDWFFDAFYGI